MAFERMEPFGTLHEEFMFGQLCALIGNVNRDSKARAEPFRGTDFMPALSGALKSDGPILLADPEAQSALIRQLFDRAAGKDG
jgi:hypothetical protein